MREDHTNILPNLSGANARPPPRDDSKRLVWSSTGHAGDGARLGKAQGAPAREGRDVVGGARRALGAARGQAGRRRGSRASLKAKQATSRRTTSLRPVTRVLTY
eukprot:CAMPEP_0206812250 /NCGR_PEP_ID=MMETSP0975-20121206/7671_1 /ASSEMBLY_ACC=CAM_ASM_000399 /TAXON_ID=483370 /ORGANISM="non described non described, Strain CCMP2097" /LENGTH=103 /DNA_ID=CAMNT_0054354387 /DNA_START=143 /DNA_END=455 /DNA_ORIENTATION=-